MMEAKCNPNILISALPLILIYYAAADPIIFDITDYGATQEADISQALTNAWMDAISSTNSSKIVIPAGTWILSQAILEGPNLAPLELENQGTIQANLDLNTMPDARSEWININYVNYFTLSGGGVFDGRGQEAWTLNDCSVTINCTKLPNNFSFNYIANSIIQDVTTLDSKFFHVRCLYSTNVTFIRFTVSAPGDSPNTDGIHVARSTMVNITDSVIGTGDDCISMGDRLTQVYIKNVTCGPGHGISIGSLGLNVNEGDISGIYVEGCAFVKTANGVRIKTWPSGPATLLVSDLHFEDLVMVNVSYPIIIDQNYCPWNQCDPTNPSLVQITNVTINNVRGWTSNANAIQLVCSEATPCDNVQIGDVNLSYVGTQTETTTTCVNILPIFFGTQNPPMCVA